MLNDGVPTTNLAEFFNISVTTIYHYLKIFEEHWTVERRSGSGRPHITAPTEDESIVRLPVKVSEPLL